MKIAIVFIVTIMTMPLVLLSQTAVAPSAGDGTSGNPYQIATLENLYWISQNPGEWNKYFIQTASIDASSTSSWDTTGWVPIGSGGGFSGSYDGNGCSISNLYINRPSASNVGLFAMLYNGAIVKKLGVVNVNVTGYYYVGGLVGLNEGIIESCFSSGSVSGSYAWIGGLAGGNDITGITRLSYSHTSATGGQCVGSLTGENFSGGEIENSYAMGNAVGSESVGGLSGTNYLGTILDCYSTGVSSGSGLIGYGGGTCTNSFWDTLTSGQTSSNGGTGRSTTDMKTLSVYTDSGWDFVSIWEMVGTNYPRLRAIPDSTLATGVEENAETPRLFSLDQNFPNPFNPSATISYDLPTRSRVSLKVYNLLGQICATLMNGIEEAGYKSVRWTANDFPSGVYLCRLEATSISNPSKSFTQVRKMVLLK